MNVKLLKHNENKSPFMLNLYNQMLSIKIIVKSIAIIIITITIISVYSIVGSYDTILSKDPMIEFNTLYF